eukprot:scaffold198706_cov82-Attheya_sp.AAC.1
MASNTLPAHAAAIARQSHANGGLGTLDPSTTATTAFTTPIARSIRYGTTGIKLRGDDNQYILPTSLQNIFHHWRSSTTRLFTLFRGYGQATFTHALRTDDVPDMLTHVVQDISPKRVATRIRTHTHAHNLNKLFETAPRD